MLRGGEHYLYACELSQDENCSSHRSTQDDLNPSLIAHEVLGMITRRFSIVLAVLWSGSLVVPSSGKAADRVVISEFMASNSSTVFDEDGNYSDWIECFNAGDKGVNLLGWHLTDEVEDPTKWTFPSTWMEPGSFVVVFASGKDRAVAGAELHTNFKLSRDGEYLALFPPRRPRRHWSFPLHILFNGPIFPMAAEENMPSPRPWYLLMPAANTRS